MISIPRELRLRSARGLARVWVVTVARTLKLKISDVIRLPENISEQGGKIASAERLMARNHVVAITQFRWQHAVAPPGRNACVRHTSGESRRRAALARAGAER